MITGDTIVCDQGAGFLKVGYAGESFPETIIPTLVGIPDNGMVGSFALYTKQNPDFTHNHEYFYGIDALTKRQQLSLTYPIEGGVVRDWDAMGGLWNHAFQDILKQDSENALRSKILLTEPPLNPIRNRNKMVEHMFETLNFGAVNLSNQSVLVLYAQGLLTGIVIECGDGVTQVVPIYEGMVPPHLVKRHCVTGKSISMYLSKLIQLRGYRSKMTADFQTVQEIKNNLCFASCNLESDRRLARETTALVENYVLPDGTAIKVGQERFEATEAYFDPSLINMECKGLSDLVFDTIQECDVSCRLQYYEHIILS